MRETRNLCHINPKENTLDSCLNGVGVVGRVLEEAVVGVEHLSGDEEEELPARTACKTMGGQPV